MSVKYDSPRDFIGEALIRLAETDDKIVVLDADLASSVTTNRFRDKYPSRFFEMGIAEQSCMSAAVGLSAEGFTPFFASMAIFTAGTAWTGLRQACYGNANIKVIGSHAGVDDGPDGASHHALEDLAMTRTIPRLTVMTPADSVELIEAVAVAAKINGPVYIRVPRANTPVLHEPGCGFPVGEAEIIFDEGGDFAVLFEGAAAAEALDGFERLKADGKNGKLVSLRTLSPLDERLIRRLATEVKTIITVENHNVRGGVAGAVGEVLAAMENHAPLRCVGIRHTFTESGAIPDIKKKYRLTGEEVIAQYKTVYYTK